MAAPTIGIVGCGAIGRAILRAADDGTLGGMEVAGVAIILTVVRSGPMPAKLTAAETLRFAGKPMQASRAEPSKMTSSSSIAQRSMPFLTTWGAPSSAAGPLRDSMTTRSM